MRRAAPLGLNSTLASSALLPSLIPSYRDQRCANLTKSRVETWAALSLGKKTKFWRQVQQETSPYNISGVEQECQIGDAARPHAGASRGISVAVVGDSIAGEVARAYRAIVPLASVTFFERSSLERSAYDVQAEIDVETGRRRRGLLWPTLVTRQWDAVFVGGLGLHELYREGSWRTPSTFVGVDWKNRSIHSPRARHRELVSKWAARFLCLSKAMATTFIFVGIMPIDVPMFLLEPLKSDWDEMLPYGLTDAMEQVEAEVEAEHQESRPNLLFLRVSDLARACPGARCDGIHFGASFSPPRDPDAHDVRHVFDLHCARSEGLWCRFLDGWLLDNVPHLVGLAPRPSARTRRSATNSSEWGEDALRRSRACFPLRKPRSDSSVGGV